MVSHWLFCHMTPLPQGRLFCALLTKVPGKKFCSKALLDNILQRGRGKPVPVRLKNQEGMTNFPITASEILRQKPSLILCTFNSPTFKHAPGKPWPHPHRSQVSRTTQSQDLENKRPRKSDITGPQTRSKVAVLPSCQHTFINK